MKRKQLPRIKFVGGRSHGSINAVPAALEKILLVQGYDSAGRYWEYYELIAGQYYFINDHPDNHYA